jgi:hypothetical protein
MRQAILELIAQPPKQRCPHCHPPRTLAWYQPTRSRGGSLAGEIGSPTAFITSGDLALARAKARGHQKVITYPREISSSFSSKKFTRPNGDATSSGGKPSCLVVKFFIYLVSAGNKTSDSKQQLHFRQYQI